MVSVWAPSASSLRFVAFFAQRPRIGFSHERPSNFSALEIEAELHVVESKLFGLTDEIVVRCETETQLLDHAVPRSAGSRCDLDPFLLSCG